MSVANSTDANPTPPAAPSTNTVSPGRFDFFAAGVESITLVEIGDHCRELGLARQKVPEQLELVDEVPRNAMGKIQKPELKKRFGAPA